MQMLMLAAAVAETTLLRMCPMAVEPVIDNRIDETESRAVSAHYGLISQETELMATRYAVACIGYTKKGFYFATRTSVPELPTTLTDDDKVMLMLQPPGATKPFVFKKKVSEGRQLEGITEYGVLCAETEMFVPFSELGVTGVTDGEKWGLQMAVKFSNEPEIATWHFAKGKPTELGTLIPDADCPIIGMDNFCKLELWRSSANVRFAWRIVNNTGSDAKLDSKTVLYRGLGFAKLDSGSIASLEEKKVPQYDLNVTVPAGETKDVVRFDWSIWPGTIAVLDQDVSANGKPFYRRRLPWDLSRSRSWKGRGEPSVSVKFFPSSDNRLIVQYCGNQTTGLCGGKLTVRGKKANKTYWEQDVGQALGFGRYDFTLPGLPDDDYTVEYETWDTAGKKYRHVRTFKIAKFPWQGSAIGKDRVIVPPFKPIAVNGDEVSFLQTGYKAGKNVLWDELRGKGENILASPMRLELNGETFEVTGTKIVEQSDDRVVREVYARRGAVGLTVTQDYDYDGFCWAKFCFDAREPVEVKSLKLSVPVKKSIARYYDTLAHAGDRREYAAPDCTIPAGQGIVWEGRTAIVSNSWARAHFPAAYHPYFYFGGTFKGVAFLIDSVRDLSADWDRSPQRLVRTDDAVVYEFALVDVPVKWEGRKRIEMGFQPTPVKPRDPAGAKFCEQLWNYPCPSNSVCFGSLNCGPLMQLTGESINVYPNNDLSMIHYILKSKKPDKAEYARRLREYVDRNRDWLNASHATSPADYYFCNQNGHIFMWGGIRCVYLDPMLITAFWPEWEMYKGEWYPEEFGPDNYFNEYMANLCPSRIDKLMWDAKVALDNGHMGLYYDCFTGFSSACLSQDEVFRRPDGKIQWSLSNMRYWREIMKRSAVLSYKTGKMYHGRPIVEQHDTMAAAVPVNSWILNGLSTERSGAGGEFPVRFPESFVMVNIIGANAGKNSRYLVSTLVGDTARQRKELKSLIPFMNAYGLFSISCAGLIGGDSEFEKALNLPFDYGWGNDDVKQYCYWDEEVDVQPVTHTGKNVKLTVARKRDSALLMFGNLGDAEDLTFDISGLGFGTDVTMTDAMTGAPVTGNALSFGRYGYRMIYVNRK